MPENSDVAQDADHHALIGEDRLPRERPDQVGDEEGSDDEEQEQVLPASAAKRDPVGERIAEEKRQDRRDPRVLERADEVPAVVPNRIPVVPPGPGEGVADVEAPRFERLVREETEWDDEEEPEIEQPGRKQEVGREIPMTVQESHAYRLARDEVLPGGDVLLVVQCCRIEVV